MTRRAYYSCGVVGDGQSNATAFRPALAELIGQSGGNWAVSYVDAALYVIAASDARADGGTADGLHDQLALEGTYLGDTIDDARAAMPPAIAAEMYPGRAYM